jgi:hypothetical protein
MLHRRTLSAICLSLGLVAASQSFADSVKISADCQLQAHYDLDWGGSRLVFTPQTRGHGRGKGHISDATNNQVGKIELSNGELWVDGQRQNLTAAQRSDLQQLELRVRRLAPEIKQLVLDGLGIVGVTLTTTTEAMLSDPRDRAALDSEAGALLARLQSKVGRVTSTRALENLAFEQEMKRFAGKIALSVRSQAMGDSAELARRFKQLKQLNIEQRVQHPAKLLEAKAMQLCASAEQIDALETAANVILPNGEVMNLLDAGDL